MWLSWLEHRPRTERSWVQFLVRHIPRFRVQSPVETLAKGKPVNVSHIGFSYQCFSLSLPLSVSLEAMKKCPLVRPLKKNKTVASVLCTFCFHHVIQGSSQQDCFQINTQLNLDDFNLENTFRMWPSYCFISKETPLLS